MVLPLLIFLLLDAFFRGGNLYRMTIRMVAYLHANGVSFWFWFCGFVAKKDMLVVFVVCGLGSVEYLYPRLSDWSLESMWVRL